MKYLKVFTDFTRDIEPLSDAERGRLLTAMLLYAKDETDTDLKGNERFIWGLVKKNIDSQRESYQKICESAANARNALSEIRLKQTETDCRSTVSEQEYDKEQEKEKDKEENKIKKSYILSSLRSDKYSEKKREALSAFVEHRKAMKKPMTEQAFKLLESKLMSLSTDEDEQIAILEQSILNGWQGVFALDHGKQKSGGNVFLDMLEDCQ